MRFESWMPFVPLHGSRCKLYNPPTPSVKMKLTIIRYFDFYPFQSFACPDKFHFFPRPKLRPQQNSTNWLFRERTLKFSRLFVKEKIYKNIYGTVNAYSTDSMQRIKLRQANYHTYVYTHIHMCVYACLKNIYTNFEF